MVNIKTQTKRATKWQEGLVNVNLFCSSLREGLQFGITTSESWGNFEERKEPLIELTIEHLGRNQISYQIPMSEFIEKLEKVLE